MKARRRYHFHGPGALYIGVTLLMGLGAVNSQNNLLFFAFGLALGSILVSGFVSGMALMNLEVRRAPTGVGRVGEPMLFVYRVYNTSRWLPAFGLVIEEGDGRRKAPWRQLLPTIQAALVHVPSRQVRHATAIVTPLARGEAELTHVRIWTTFPFGILKKSVTFVQPGQTLIRPALTPTARQLLDQALSGIGSTERVSQRIGRDAEFYGLREYAPGDPLRHIAWRATARTGELVVREAYAAVSADIVIGLSFADAEAPDAPPDESDERAISVAAGMADVACRRGARVLLISPVGHLRVESRTNGTESNAADPIEDALARLALEGNSSLRKPQSVNHEGGSLIVIHSKSIDPSIAPPGALHISADRAVAPVRPVVAPVSS